MSIHLLNFKNTSIVLGQNLIQSNLLIDACKTQSVAIICDDTVSKIYGENLLRFLQKSALDVYLFNFPDGEESKSRQTKEFLEDQMQSKGLGKDTTIIGIGGGVTTDLTAFLAATYLRGVQLILIPTSLIAMVDAAIGGKNGVNTQYGKNLIGSFYLPHTLIIDYDFLESLAQKQFNDGLIEIIKIALVYDRELFDLVESSIDALFEKNDVLKMIVKTSCELKLKIVEQDFDESLGLRRILNLGHTVGHAIEKEFEYRVSHGQAVALGIIAESFIACEMGYLPLSDFNRLTSLLKPFAPNLTFEEDRLMRHMMLDKKSKDKTARFVLIDYIGHAMEFNQSYCTMVEDDVIYDALRFIKKL